MKNKLKEFLGGDLAGPLKRFACAALIPVYLLTSVPVSLLAAPVAGPEQEFVLKPPADLANPVLTPKNVRVNKTKVQVAPPSQELVFSQTPKDLEISRARVFADGLVSTGKSSAEENRDLAKVLGSVREKKGENIAEVAQFMAKHPNSVWNVSLELNLGTQAYNKGYFSKAILYWESAWKRGKDLKNPAIRPQVDRAFGELVRMHARIGNRDRLKELFGELGDRFLSGSATELVANSREGYWMMENQPGISFRCGPMALASILQSLDPSAPFPKEVMDSVSPQRGFALSEVNDLAVKLKLKYQMVSWSGSTQGAVPPLPALVHWKVGHYGAIIREENGQFLMKDPTFGQDLWISRDALLSEASGYFMVPKGTLPAGWKTVSTEEAKTVFGKGNTGSKDTAATSSADAKTPPVDCKGMAVSSAHLMLVSLNIQDAPVGYIPPKGPPVIFKLTYNQREINQPSTFSYSNLGFKWTFDWLSYVQDDPGSPSSDVNVFAQGGGAYTFKSFNATTQSFALQVKTQAILKRTSSSSYEYSLPDGSIKVYALSNGVTGADRRVFLTEEKDPTGNSITYSYDSSFRLVSVTDALGQVTTLTYAHPSDSLKITKVTDPFGRYATLEYDTSLRLKKITDVIGITSEFTYGTDDFIASLITPYGTETYTTGGSGIMRWLNMADAQGDIRRVEYLHDAPGIASTEPASVVPAGESLTNDYLAYRNAFYWDKKAWKLYPGDYTKAEITHFLHTPGGTSTSGIVESRKKPLENRIWYKYPGQTSSIYEGSMDQPEKILQNLNAVNETPVTQITQLSYNSLGNVTQTIDSLDRRTAFTYASNGIDLLSVRQTTGSINELLASATYNTQHQPLTTTDAAGQVTTMTYNGAGQLATVQNAKSETTTLTYDSNGYLTQIDGAASGSGDSTLFAYDSFGRPRTVTDSEGYVKTFDYDALDRPTKVTYPDTTFDQVIYSRLDPEWFKDREGRWTRIFYNKIRQKVAEEDSMGRTVNFEWCKCGALQGLTDALGRVTKWKYDVQGRLLEKTYPDNTKLTYTYESATSRLKSVVDAKGQRTNYEYFLDNQLKKVSYTNLSGAALSPATPSVEWTYDTNYGRLSSMTDGTGVTAYSYNPIASTPAIGAGKLASVDGPLSGTTDAITFTYDQLGRVIGRSINSVAQTVSYDALGRATGVVNSLGTFAYHYLNNTSRLSSIDLPNGQKTQFNYFNNAGDQRLEEIKNMDAQSTPGIISKFNYTYAPAGKILTWRQENSGAPSVPKVYNFRYDPVDQLTGATLKNASTSAILKENVYRYDKAGNRTSEQVDLSVISSTNNNLNQVTATSGGGPLEFAGTVTEPSTVTVGGDPAQVDASGNFRGSKVVGSGTSTVAIVATDGSGNATTQNYQVTVPSGTSRTLTYDLNGNMTDDGAGKTYAWDAANRLVKITYGSSGSTEFTYDGMSRRVKMLEKDGSGTTTSDKRFVWSRLEIAEERNSSNTVVKRFYPQGVEVVAATSPANKLFYTRDHLGSVRELTDANAVVRGRWDFDSYGKRSSNLITTGALEVDFGYTGHLYHSRSVLNLAPYRAYDADLGKWLSRDPISENGGINLYGYVNNDPVNMLDPFGLDNINWGLVPEEVDLIDRSGKDFKQDGYSVGAHFIGGSVRRPNGTENGEPVSPEDLAKIIMLDPNYNPNKPVYLNSCNSGGPSNGGAGPSYADRLAKALHNSVWAPTGRIERTSIWAPLNPFTQKSVYPFGFSLNTLDGGSYVESKGQ